MSGYRGDGYGVYGDHGDDDFYEEMRRERGGGSGNGGRDDDRMRNRGNDRWRASRDREDDGRGFMFDRDQGMMDRGGDRVRSWVSGHNEDPYRAGQHGRDEHRGEGFLERAGHQPRRWMQDDGEDDRRGSRPPMGLGDPARRGGGLGMSQDRQRFSGHGPHDHYLSWRERQMAELDSDYDEYCRENEQKFSSDFETWRQSRRSANGGSGSPAAAPASDQSRVAGPATSTASPEMTGNDDAATTDDGVSRSSDEATESPRQPRARR